MSRVSGAEGRDAEVWAEQADASKAEVRINSIGTSTKSICLATANTNLTLIGIGSSGKHLRI